MTDALFDSQLTDALFALDVDTDAPAKHACSGLGCGVCGIIAQARATVKLQQAGRNADHAWITEAEILMRYRASLGVDFTTDEVMEDLESSAVGTHDPRALGSVVRKLLREKVIVEVGMTRSRRRHAARIPVYCGVKR